MIHPLRPAGASCPCRRVTAARTRVPAGWPPPRKTTRPRRGSPSCHRRCEAQPESLPAFGRLCGRRSHSISQRSEPTARGGPRSFAPNPLRVRMPGAPGICAAALRAPRGGRGLREARGARAGRRGPSARSSPLRLGERLCSRASATSERSRSAMRGWPARPAARARDTRSSALPSSAISASSSSRASAVCADSPLSSLHAARSRSASA